MDSLQLRDFMCEVFISWWAAAIGDTGFVVRVSHKGIRLDGGRKGGIV